MVRLTEKMPMRGIFQMRVYRRGVLVEEYADHNLIVNDARNQMAHLVAGDATNRNIAKIAFGTSGASPAETDTGITGQFAKNVIGFSYPELGQVQIDWGLLVSENNGMAIREFGLLTQDGKLFARRTRENPIYKESDISMEGHWTIIF